jgi:hypothetical protein
MRIYKLIPTNPNDFIWRFWEPEPVMVRAEDESQAHHLAALATTKSFRLEPGVPIPMNPWSAHQKITDPPMPLPSVIQDVTDHQNQFSAAGEAMVLRHGEPS